MHKAVWLCLLVSSWVLVAWLTGQVHVAKGRIGLGFDEPTFISECLHPMGGGKVKRGGTFPALNDSFLGTECAQELSDYFDAEDGQYGIDVARVAEAARRHFDDLQDVTPASPKMVIVFDIDETTLSNAAEWQSRLKEWKDGLGGRRSAAGSRLSVEATFQKAALGVSDRPPLAPMLGLYHYFYSSGYSVAFITGRNEAARNETEVNLKAAGYGSLCKGSPGISADSLQRVRDSIVSKGLSSGGAMPNSDDDATMIVSEGLTVDAGRGIRRPGRPCYVALHLRDLDDGRLASVYKPERRGDLERDGFEVYGNFGDQFSDLDGPSSAPHSFKLPNPAYLIL